MKDPDKLDFQPGRMERLLEHWPGISDISLMVLKGHLLAEEILDSIIETYCRDKGGLEDVEIRLPIKVKLARALYGHPEAEHIWRVADLLNSLRNKVAHRLDSPRAKNALANFINAASEHSPGMRHADNELNKVELGMGWLHGALSAVESRAKHENSR